MSSTSFLLCSMLVVTQFNVRWAFSTDGAFSFQRHGFHTLKSQRRPDSQWEHWAHNNPGLESKYKSDFPSSEVVVKFWWILQIWINRYDLKTHCHLAANTVAHSIPPSIESATETQGVWRTTLGRALDTQDSLGSSLVKRPHLIRPSTESS